jgi:glycosyltransferase involved in cell wall biosynthesis
VVVGHFGPYDRLQAGDIERLVPWLAESRPSFRVVMLGHGSTSAVERLRLKAPHLGRQLHATGPLDAAALSRHLQVCDVIVQPYVDGASTRRTTLMAALAHGVPTVTTVGRLSESFWRESGAVSTVPAGDVQAVVEATVALAADPARRRELSVAARALYAARFDIAHIVTAMRDGRCEAV